MELMFDLCLVSTPPHYDHPWWVDNILYQFDRINITPDNIHVIRNPVHSKYWNKLAVFDLCKDDRQYLFLDLDTIIVKDNVLDWLSNDLSILFNWWNSWPATTSVNSSVMSWRGDYSYIYKQYLEDEEFYNSTCCFDDLFLGKYFSKDLKFIQDRSCAYSYRWHKKSPMKIDYDSTFVLFNSEIRNMFKKEWKDYILYPIPDKVLGEAHARFKATNS